MIIYADDITQIVQKKDSQNYLSRETEREIIKINQYENKWKIKTNVDKFQIIPIGRKGFKKVKIDNDTYEFANTGKALGTIISKNGFTSHITSRINLAKSKLPLLFRFLDLSQNNKKTLYLALIRSVLEYPPVILHPITKTQAIRMQRVQNKAARVITKTRLSDRKTSKFINEQAELIPINISIHNQAKKIWQKIELDIGRDVLDKLELEENRDFTDRFPSSRLKCNTNILEIY